VSSSDSAGPSGKAALNRCASFIRAWNKTTVNHGGLGKPRVSWFRQSGLTWRRCNPGPAKADHSCGPDDQDAHQTHAHQGYRATRKQWDLRYAFCGAAQGLSARLAVLPARRDMAPLRGVAQLRAHGCRQAVRGLAALGTGLPGCTDRSLTLPGMG
jgi:hypothetical protein